MKLTERQKEFAELLLMGMRGVEIAKTMGVHLQTEKQYLRDFVDRLRIPEDRTHRVAVAVKLHEMRKELGIRCMACELDSVKTLQNDAH